MRTTHTILLRRGIATDWEFKNIVLAKQEAGYDVTNKRVKIGDGVTPWNNLPYSVDPFVHLIVCTKHVMVRRDTSQRWKEANPILQLGEPAYDLDLIQNKVGDGVTPWNDLNFIN